MKHYNPFLVYCLAISISNDTFYYIGALARPSQKYLTENDILNFSGNPLNRSRRNKTITKDEYFERTKILFIEEQEVMETTFQREKELIKQYKSRYGNHCLNKTLKDSRRIVGVPNSLEANRKISETMKGRKLSDETKRRQSKSHCKKVINTSTGTIYESVGDLANYLGVKSPSLVYGLQHGSKRYRDFKYV